MGKAALAAWAFAAVLAPCAPAAAGEAAIEGQAAAMRDRYAALARDPVRRPLGRTLFLDSSEGETRASGEIHALIGYPFDDASAALGDPSRWCDILILPPNTKYCVPGPVDGAPGLHVGIGGKHDLTIERAHRLQVPYRVAARTERSTSRSTCGPAKGRWIRTTTASSWRRRLRTAASCASGLPMLGPAGWRDGWPRTPISAPSGGARWDPRWSARTRAASPDMSGASAGWWSATACASTSP